MVNIYQGFYDLLQNYIFGGTVSAQSFQDLFCILASGGACLLLICFPFWIIYRILRKFI